MPQSRILVKGDLAMKKIALLMAILLCITGCSEEEKISYNKNLYTVQDRYGTTVTFSVKPVRVLPISKGITEITLDMIDTERIVAVSDEATRKTSFVRDKAEKVGIITSRYPSIETILQLKPDLVLVPETVDAAKIKTLREMGVKVVVTSAPGNMKEIKNRISFIADVLDAKEEGAVMIKKMEAKLDAIAEMKRKVNQEGGQKSLIAFSRNGAFGREGGLFDDLCRTAGIINGAAGSGLRKLDYLSKEQVINIDPDYFLLPKCESGSSEEKFVEEILTDPAYQSLKAVRLGQTIILEEEYYKYNVSQYAADAAYTLAAAVYRPYLREVEISEYH